MTTNEPLYKCHVFACLFLSVLFLFFKFRLIAGNKMHLFVFFRTGWRSSQFIALFSPRAKKLTFQTTVRSLQTTMGHFAKYVYEKITIVNFIRVSLVFIRVVVKILIK